MKISLKWEKPIRLKRMGRTPIRVTTANAESFPSKSGVYIFARRFGKNIAPLYIGQASKLRGRIDGQFNNLRLMMAIKNAPTGHRILLIARLYLQPGQRMSKVLDIVESALIKNALAQGHDLINQHGTKTKVHVIRSKGNASFRQVAPLTMFAERK